MIANSWFSGRPGWDYDTGLALFDSVVVLVVAIFGCARIILPAKEVVLSNFVLVMLCSLGELFPSRQLLPVLFLRLCWL